NDPGCDAISSDTIRGWIEQCSPNDTDTDTGTVSEPLRVQPDRPKAKVVNLTQGALIKPVKVEWLWPGWLALGKFHTLGGPKGTGKSTLAYTFAAVVSIGGKWPDGRQGQLGDVLVWSGEDDAADTIVPRFMAAGGDSRRLWIVNGVSVD